MIKQEDKSKTLHKTLTIDIKAKMMADVENYEKTDFEGSRARTAGWIDRGSCLGGGGGTHAAGDL